MLPSTYARITKYFIIVGLFIFLIISLNLDVIATIFERMNFSEDYSKGLVVVPILLAANLFLGIYFNISTWYKVTDKTKYGAAIAIIGALLTIGLNYWWIPIIGFIGSAYATLICYVFMVILALYFGRRFYPIPYQLKRLAGYIGIAVFLYFLYDLVLANFQFSDIVFWGVKALLLSVFIVLVYRLEKPEISQET